jgi:uridine phosphorylase
VLQHHIQLDSDHLRGNAGLGRTVFLPGSASRAAAIAEHFEGCTVIDNPRGLKAHLGLLRVKDQTLEALAISSGMGPGSAEVVMQELLAVGARRVVRVGSAGAMDPAIPVGSVVVLSGAVRDEQTSRHTAPLAFPAVSHPTAVQAMVDGATAAGLAEHCFVGVGHTKASLYAREFGAGPLGEQNLAYGNTLARCGAIASDMEASVLMVLANAASAGRATPVGAGNAAVPVQAAAVLGIYGGSDSHMELDPAKCALADRRSILTALHGALAWARADGLVPQRGSGI